MPLWKVSTTREGLCFVRHTDTGILITCASRFSVCRTTRSKSSFEGSFFTNCRRGFIIVFQIRVTPFNGWPFIMPTFLNRSKFWFIAPAFVWVNDRKMSQFFRKRFDFLKHTECTAKRSLAMELRLDIPGRKVSRSSRPSRLQRNVLLMTRNGHTIPISVKLFSFLRLFRQFLLPSLEKRTFHAKV